MRVLIATDGSNFGKLAVEFAARVIDSGTETDANIVTVIEPAAGTEFETIIESTEELRDPNNPEEQKAEGVLREAEGFLKDACQNKNVTISSEVLAGPAARTIVEAADSWDADLIVVSSHGRGFWKRAWMGSVSARVANHANCPVLIVRGKIKH